MNKLRFIMSVGCLAISTATYVMGTEYDNVRQDLLKGVDAIDAPGGQSGAVWAFGENSFPLIVGDFWGTKVPVVSGTQFGKGRIVAFGHENFFRSDVFHERKMKTFSINLLKWLSGKENDILVAVHPSFSGAKILGKLPGVRVQNLHKLEDLKDLPVGTVFAAAPDALKQNADETIRTFVQCGGGFLCFGVGWGWQQIHPTQTLTSDNAFNRLLGPAGLYLDESMPNRTGTEGFQVSTPVPEGTRLCDALEIIKSGKKVNGGMAVQVFSAITSASTILPPSERAFWKEVDLLLSPEMLKRSVPAPGRPLNAARLKERISLSLFQNRWLSNPLKPAQAHPAAAVYPGLPPAGSPRISRDVTVDLSIQGWHSTGLFAVAGEPVTVTLPEGMEREGIGLRIGATTCRNTAHTSWNRAPVVDMELPITTRTFTLSTPFGGLVYLTVPAGKKGKIVAKVGPACPAPWYQSGRDTPETWREKIRNLPAPMAELECGKIIFALPTSIVRTLDDPEPLFALWSRVLDLDAKLTGLPTQRSFPERFSADVDLCAGYMHAGYPIMVPYSTVPDLINVKVLKEGKRDNVWGFYHEMGHNHQNPDWTFDGTSEVTVNFFTLYCLEHICNIKPREGRLGGEGWQRRVKQWQDKGSPYSEWKADAFLALEFFVRIQQKYGWETFEKLFAEYRTLKPEERPKTDLEKRQQWAQRLSRITGDDLVPLFQEWHILP